MKAATTATINGAQYDSATLLQPASVLTNPSEHLDRLCHLSPSAEYFASGSILASIGYSVVNQQLFAYRKEHAKAKSTAPTVDWHNDTYAEMFEHRMGEEMTADSGHTTLPEFNALELTGVYMGLFYMQNGNLAYSGKYPPKQPQEILHEMQTQDRTIEIREAQRALDDARIAQSPARDAIIAARTKGDVALSEYQVRQHQAEMAYVVDALKRVIPERLTNEHWNGIPLYIQYKLTYFVYSQVIRAAAQEANAFKRDDDKFEQLMELADVIHLELEAALRSSEVQYAFSSGRLDERFDIRTICPVAHEDAPTVHVVKAEQHEAAPSADSQPALTDNDRLLAAALTVAAAERKTLHLKH